MLTVTLAVALTSAAAADNPFAAKYVKALQEAGVAPTREGIAACLKQYEPGAQTDQRLDELIEQLGDDDFYTRESATQQLIHVAVPADALKQAAESDDPEVRWRARLVLKQTDRQQADKRRSDLLYKAFVVVTDREIKGLTDEVLKTVPACDSDYLRVAMERALTATVTSEDADLLEGYLTSDNVHTRNAAATALAHVLGGKAREHLLPLLSDERDVVRLTAAEALLRHGSPEALTALGRLLDSEQLAIRNRSIQLLRATLRIKLPYSAYGSLKERRHRSEAWRRAIEEHLQGGGSARTTLPADVRLGHLLVASYKGNYIVELDPAVRPCFRAEVNGVVDVQILPRGRRLVVSYKDREVAVIDADGSTVWTLDDFPEPPIRAAHLTSGETLVATISGSLLVFGPDQELHRRKDLGGILHDIHVLPEGHVLVANSGRGHIVELDEDLEEVWRSPEIAYPTSVHRCDDGKLLVASFRNSQVVQLDRDGNMVPLRQDVDKPRQVMQLEDGNLMVLDAAGIHLLDRNGRKLRTVYEQPDLIRFDYTDGIR